MHIRPSVPHSYKHLISLNSITIFILYIYVFFFNNFRNFILYEVTDALHKSFFPSSLKRSVTEFGFLFFSHRKCPPSLPFGPRAV
jgi:hypothetical protein